MAQDFRPTIDRECVGLKQTGTYMGREKGETGKGEKCGGYLPWNIKHSQFMEKGDRFGSVRDGLGKKWTLGSCPRQRSQAASTHVDRWSTTCSLQRHPEIIRGG